MASGRIVSIQGDPAQTYTGWLRKRVKSYSAKSFCVS